MNVRHPMGVLDSFSVNFFLTGLRLKFHLGGKSWRHRNPWTYEEN